MEDRQQRQRQRQMLAWLSGATLSTLAQQHAYITEHVLGVIQSASVYSAAITRPSSGTFTAPQVAIEPPGTSGSLVEAMEMK